MVLIWAIRHSIDSILIMDNKISVLNGINAKNSLVLALALALVFFLIQGTHKVVERVITMNDVIKAVKEKRVSVYYFLHVPHLTSCAV